MFAGGATARRLFSWADFTKNWVKVEAMASRVRAKGVEMAQDVAASKAFADLSSWALAGMAALLTPRALKVRKMLD